MDRDEVGKIITTQLLFPKFTFAQSQNLELAATLLTSG